MFYTQDRQVMSCSRTTLQEQRLSPRCLPCRLRLCRTPRGVDRDGCSPCQQQLVSCVCCETPQTKPELPHKQQLIKGLTTQPLCQAETQHGARCKGCHQPPTLSPASISNAGEEKPEPGTPRDVAVWYLCSQPLAPTSARIISRTDLVPVPEHK